VGRGERDVSLCPKKRRTCSGHDYRPLGHAKMGRERCRAGGRGYVRGVGLRRCVVGGEERRLWCRGRRGGRLGIVDHSTSSVSCNLPMVEETTKPHSGQR